jgi:hypothetical protein
MKQEVRRGRKFVEYHLGIGWGGIGYRNEAK